LTKTDTGALIKNKNLIFVKMNAKNNTRIYKMPFATVQPIYINKVKKKDQPKQK
jgi:hypothetical protein